MSLPTLDLDRTASPAQLNGDRARAWLEELRPLLPIQNPLWAFVHNNILQNLEALPFREALRRAAGLYRARPFEGESFYRGELNRGRLRRDCLNAVLREHLPELGPEPLAAFLQDRSLGDDLAPLQALRLAPRLAGRHPVRHERQLKDLLVPIVAGHLDQGLAAWPSPWRNQRLWLAFEAEIAASPNWGFAWSERLRERLLAHGFLHSGAPALSDGDLDVRLLRLIEAEVQGCAPAGQEAEYCLETLFVLKGWSGLVQRLELEPELAPVAAPKGLRLLDWLAILLLVQHALDDWFLAELGLERAELAQESAPIETTRGVGRAYLWQQAYERSFAGEFIGHLLNQPRKVQGAPAAPRASVQALLCMDDREESLRRALEAPGNGVMTFGVVGFFGLDMQLQSVTGAKPTRQCPPVVAPSRLLREVPLDPEGDWLMRLREVGLRSSHNRLSLYYHSRTLLRGFLVSIGLGLASFVPLLVGTLLPGRLSRWRAKIRRLAFPKPRTRILSGAAAGGYTHEEQARIVERVLSAAGLTRDFAPIVAVIAHGATSSNNPFQQAYGCGACSGNSGEPNARIFAALANRQAVRTRLAERGLVIPDQTLFVPCHHDTTLGRVRLLDSGQVAGERANELEALERTFERAAAIDAVERGRRFAQAPHGGQGPATPAALLQHFEDRAFDLSQPRPEYGHNRVAACIVGRRALTSGLSLDRRSFLVSYDPSQDPTGRLLQEAVLGSVPVAVNIAMDYYFSRVDPDGFGAGSKLPLNVVGLLGVMTGSKSDLRIGLARQMVELHEPMRVLVLLEATQAAIKDLLAASARLARLAKNHWMQLGRVDPELGTIELWQDGQWLPWLEVWPEFGAERRPAGQLPLCLQPTHDARPLGVLP